MSTLTKEYHIIVIFAIIYVKITIEKQKLLCYNKFTEQKKGRANYEKIIDFSCCFCFNAHDSGMRRQRFRRKIGQGSEYQL